MKKAVQSVPLFLCVSGMIIKYRVKAPNTSCSAYCTKILTAFSPGKNCWSLFLFPSAKITNNPPKKTILQN